MAHRLDQKLILTLLTQGYVTTEAESRRTQAARQKAVGGGAGGKKTRKPVFSSVPVPKAPAAPKWPFGTPLAVPKEIAGKVAVEEPSTSRGVVGFLMTLQRTDVGVGQTTKGTPRRSPEVFIPLAARDYAPGFWGWPSQFTADPGKPGKMDRYGVKIWLGAAVIKVNMMTWPDKHDFRLRSEFLRSAGKIGDVLRLEQTDSSLGFDYMAHIIPRGTMEHRHCLSFCVNKTAGKSDKLWGYY